MRKRVRRSRKLAWPSRTQGREIQFLQDAVCAGYYLFILGILVSQCAGTGCKSLLRLGIGRGLRFAIETPQFFQVTPPRLPALRVKIVLNGIPDLDQPMLPRIRRDSFLNA